MAETVDDEGNDRSQNFSRNEKNHKRRYGISESEPDDGQGFIRRKYEGEHKSEPGKKNAENKGNNSGNFMIFMGIYYFTATFAVHAATDNKAVIVLLSRFLSFACFGT